MVCYIVMKGSNIVHTTKSRKANWIGHILRKNCFLNHFIDGKIEGRIKVTGRRRTRSTQLLDGLKEKMGYCQLTEETLDRSVRRTGCGPVTRQTADAGYGC